MELKLKEINRKLFKVQMILEECTSELQKLNDELDKSLEKPKGITKSSQFVFGD